MKVVMPALIENPTTEAEIAQNATRAAYQELFNDLQRDYAALFAAQDPEIVIDDLISYFRALDLVTVLSDTNTPVPTGWVLPGGQRPLVPKNKYFRLPLDEPYFTINTDTRTISVPADFANNGLGVQGDANAEIVFFKCPRLYDTIDLYELVKRGNCWVQWYNGASRESGNSQVLLCDATQQEMYLGWMITSAMTKVSGTLEFSMRWFQTDGEKITYSLSTQKTSCVIKPTMDLDVNTEAEDMSDLVYTRPIYAHVINTMEGLPPRISVNLVSGEYELEPLDPEDPGDAELLETYPVEDYPDGIKIFTVTAATPNNMNITYQWYKGGVELLLQEDIDAGAKTNEFIVREPGTYYVMIGNGNNADGFRYITSPSVVIPAPEDIKYINAVGEKYFGFGCYSNGTVLTTDITTTKGTAPNGKVHVDWYYAPMVVNGVLKTKAQAVYGSEPVKSEILTAVENQTYITSSYTPTANMEGWVKCVASNHLNNDATEPITCAQDITVRAEPANAASVNITWDSEAQAIRVTNVQFPEGAASMYHPDEWMYRWNNGSELSLQQGSGIGVDHSILHVVPPSDRSVTQVTYSVQVSHIVYNDNKVDPSALPSTAVMKESEMWRPSNQIVLKFTWGNGSSPEITRLQ